MLALGAIVGVLLALAPAMAQTMRFVAAPLPPLIIDAAGQPDGIVPQVLHDLSDATGVPLTIEFLPQARALYEAERRSDLGMAGLTRTAEREATFKWVGPVLSDSIVLVTRRGERPAPATLDAARSWTVGAVRGGASVPVLRAAGFADIIELQDAETGARMLDSGRIETWATPKLSGLYLFRTLGFDPALLEIGPTVRPNDLYLGLPRSTPDLVVARWQKALERLKASGRIETITARFVAGP
jgi:polar amino acid transport system substrate-binding protein